MRDDRWGDFTDEELRELRAGARTRREFRPSDVWRCSIAGALEGELDRALRERQRASSRVRVQVQTAPDGLWVMNTGAGTLRVVRGPSPGSPDAIGVRVSPGGDLRVPAYSIVIELADDEGGRRA